MTRLVYKALYKMEGELEVKLPHKIELEKPQLNLVQPQGKAELIAEAEENANSHQL